MRFTRRWQEWLSLAGGAWLFVSPWVLGFTGAVAAAWTAYLLGALVFVAALWALTARRAQSVETVGALLGALVFVSPWAVGFSALTRAFVDALAVGTVVLLASLWAVMIERSGRGPGRRSPTA